jgi:hypothetical protein
MLAGNVNHLLKCLYVHGEKLNAVIVSASMSFDPNSRLIEYQRLKLRLKGLPSMDIDLDIPLLIQIVSAFYPQLPVIVFADNKEY